MNLFEIILIGIALSMDACALTIANCTTHKDCLDKKMEWAMPTAFALFQGIMPLIGFLIGSVFSNAIGTIADYLTSAIFFFLSGKIVFDIIKDGKEESCCPVDGCCKSTKFTYSTLIIQAVATSIDALAVGVTLINLTFSVYIAVLVIAVVTFILVSTALIFGKSLGKLFGTYAEWFGAGIIFILAVKSLVQAIA